MLISAKALFALGLFDWEDQKESTRPAFIATIILVAGATYSLAWLLIWAVHDPDRTRRIVKHLEDLCRRALLNLQASFNGMMGREDDIEL